MVRKQQDMSINFSTNKDRMIRVISNNSDRYGSELLEFMNRYHLTALKDAREDQLGEYIKERHF